jgi:hypothetical protein
MVLACAVVSAPLLGADERTSERVTPFVGSFGYGLAADVAAAYREVARVTPHNRAAPAIAAALENLLGLFQ